MTTEGCVKETQTHTQETGPGREANTSFFIKASFLGRGVETFLRGLMAPRIKGIQIQKELSKRQPHSADRGRSVQPSGCWGTRPADLPGHGKGASSIHAGFRTTKWLALFEVAESKDLERPQWKMAPRERHQLQFTPTQRDQLWGFPFSSI